MKITGKNYIGSRLSSSGETLFQTFNPRNNTSNSPVFTEANDLEVDEAVRLAFNAFNSYNSISGKERAQFLRSIADEILALDQDLIDVFTLESGLPEGRAIGERGRTIAQLRMFADHIENDLWRNPTIDKGDDERTPMIKPDLRQLLIPLGPVVVFGASNFPLAFSTAGGDTASALAAGCPVIVKSHPMHAGTGELVASAIIEAAKKTNMPEGVFSNLNSKGISVGQKLVKHEQIAAVGFTGSIKGGTALMELASRRKVPIPVFAEMGSVNPVILTHSALEARGSKIAVEFSNSITLGAGQFCTNPGLFLGVKGKELSQFITTLETNLSESEPQCMLHPTIHDNFEKLSDAMLVHKENKPLPTRNPQTAENFAHPRIIAVSGESFLSNSQLHHEVFGPFAIVVECNNMEELLEIIDQMEGQLTGTIMVEKEEYSIVSTLVESLEKKVGRIIFNGVPTGVEISFAMTHGGPFPASSDSRFTAIGSQSIKRWVRPISFQDFPTELMPAILR